MDRLSKREREVLFYIGEGYNLKAIAEQLDVSQGTVSTYLKRIKQKLDIHSIKNLMKFAIEYCKKDDDL